MNNENQSSLENRQAAANATLCLLQILAITIEVFVHKGFGSRYIGRKSVQAIPVILLFAFCFPYDFGPMFCFLIAYIIMCFLAGTGLRRGEWRGEPIHSYYSGEPYLLKYFKNCDEGKVKDWEAVLIFIIGIVLYQEWIGLGIYLMIASFSILVLSTIRNAYDRARALNLSDAMIDQSYVVERLQKQRGL